MSNKIYIETEEYKDGGEGDFYAFALTGDTYEAKDIIKSNGFLFSDQVGHGKAWRTPIIFKRDFAPGNAHFANTQTIVVNVRSALIAAGYEFYRR